MARLPYTKEGTEGVFNIISPPSTKPLKGLKALEPYPCSLVPTPLGHRDVSWQTENGGALVAFFNGSIVNCKQQCTVIGSTLRRS